MLSQQMIHLRFSPPAPPPQPFVEDFFVGAWHPEARLSVDFHSAANQGQIENVNGPNWFLLGSRCPGFAGSPSLVHGLPSVRRHSEPDALAFRGYLLDPALHSYSGTPAMRKYWETPPERLNGVFAAVRVFPERLELVTDLFGMAPLYYRRLEDGTVLFATSPRYLVRPGDGINLIAARMIFHRKAVCGDINLAPDTFRAPAGSWLTFTPEGASQREWLSFSKLPQGEEPITEKAVIEAEEVFQQAVARCLRLLPDAQQSLPLSSGHDSRRLLSALRKQKASFRAITIRILSKEDRDLDGRYTEQMAKDLGFPCEVLPPAGPDQYAKDDLVCRLLLSSQLMEHTWILPLIRRLNGGPSLVFDGVGGDIFGNTGYGIAELHTMPEAQKFGEMARLALPDSSAILEESAWPTLEETRAAFVDMLRVLPEGKNRTDYAFVLLRARFGTGMWSQHLLPPGQLPVFPFFDLDHIFLAMRLNPLEKIPPQTLQARCLERCWPDLFAYPGTRNIPNDLPPGSPDANNRLRMAQLRQLELESPLSQLRPRVRSGKYLLAQLARRSDAVAYRVAWWLAPLLMLSSWQRNHHGCWSAEPSVPVGAITAQGEDEQLEKDRVCH